MAFTVATFVAFTILVAVLSWWKTRDDDLSTKEGYFLAGRGLPGIVIAGSLMMTNLSAEQLVGTNGQAFAGNMSTMAWEATSAFALIVLAFVFLPKLLRGGIATIPEFFEMRYDTFTMRLFSLLFLIAYVVTMLPTILYSGAVALVKIFDLESMFGISYFSAITLICIGTGIIGMCYAVFGGLKAVAYSDTINGVGLIIGGFAIPILGILALGKLDGGGFMAGLDHLISATPEKMNAWSAPNALPPEVPWPLLLTGMFVNNLFYWATNQSIIQRSLGGKNLAESQKGAIWAGFFKCLDVFVIVLPGIIAFQLLAANGQMDTSVGMAADQAYPLLVMEVLPKPLMGFFAAVMFGAILSSFNSVLNSVNTMFTMDIYKEFINKNASESKLVSVGKNIGIVFAIFSVIVGPMVYFFPAGLKTFLDSFVMLVGLPVLSGVFGGFFFNCLPKYSARFIMVFHIICYGGFMLLSPSYSLFGGNEGSIHYLYAVSILWPLEMLIMYLMHRRNKSKGAAVWVQQDVGAVDLTPWKYSKLVSVIVIVCVLLVYLAFSPLGIGA